MTPDLTTLSATDLTARMARGDVTCAQVMAAVLDRIAAVNPSLNAIVSLRPRADLMAEADAADRGARSGPLHGLPVAVKDLVATRGLRTTWGSPLFADHVPQADDRVAARLRAAGAIVIGKTNTPEFGAGSHSYNPVFGVTRNPYDTSRTAGGSSGGAAAALAARMVALADGSDMMGSLRNPAAFCNVYGFRPTWGMVPGDVAGDLFLHQLATDGPMARCPQDLALLLRVLAGPDPRLPVQVPVPDLHDLTPPDLATLRIGWLRDWGGAWPFEDGILRLCDTALDACRARVDCPGPPLSRDAVWRAWCDLRSWAIAARLDAVYAQPAKRAALKPELIWEIERGHALSAMQIDRASRVRSDLYRAFSGLFDRYDALAIPSAQVWPFPAEWDWPRAIGGVEMDSYHRWMETVIPVSLTGLPAVAVPAGFGPQGLPTGLTLFGPRGSDARLLALAEAWHRHTDWPGRRPPA